jgi:transcriptional pleiotropic regulator of transition state genes
MKATGIVRSVDNLGRVVLPMELRRTLGIEISDPLEVYTDEDKIILRKYTPGCTFCDNSSDLTTYKGKRICPQCLATLKKQA